MTIEPTQMFWQLVGHGDVVVFNIPGDNPVSVAISDAAFVEAVGKMVGQAKSYPTSKLRAIRVDSER